MLLSTFVYYHGLFAAIMSILLLIAAIVVIIKSKSELIHTKHRLSAVTAVVLINLCSLLLSTISIGLLNISVSIGFLLQYLSCGVTAVFSLITMILCHIKKKKTIQALMQEQKEAASMGKKRHLLLLAFLPLILFGMLLTRELYLLRTAEMIAIFHTGTDFGDYKAAYTIHEKEDGLQFRLVCVGSEIGGYHMAQYLPADFTQIDNINDDVQFEQNGKSYCLTLSDGVLTVIENEKEIGAVSTEEKTTYADGLEDIFIRNTRQNES